MKTEKLNKDIEEQLRQATIHSELSRYRISLLSGVADSALCYFVKRQRTLTLTSAARVAEVLGLELKPTRKE